MAHAWENLVVSGVDKPRILVLGENLCINPFFTNNLDGYDVSGATIDRSEDFESYRQYMCNCDFGSGSDYVEYTFDYGEVVQGKTFLLALIVLSQGEFTLKFYHSTEFGDELFESQLYKKAFIVATAPDDGGTATTISFRVYGDSNVKFDNVYFSEVLYDLEMPQPNDSGQVLFSKDTDGKGELWTGYTKEYNVKWIPNYSASYFAIAEAYEEYRQLISEAEMLFCIPHMDFAYGFLGKWMDDNFERNYIFGQYVGHSGVLAIKGQEYVNQELAVQLIVYYQVTVSAFLPT